MRLYTIFLIFLVFTTIGLDAQNTGQLMNAKRVIWCGIDFSFVKCIGEEGFTNPQAIADDYFDKWNEMVILDPKKFNVSRACGEKGVVFKTDVAHEMNKKVGHEDLVIEHSYKVSYSDIEDHITNYPQLTGTDVAFTFIVESLNKTKERGYLHAIFFDTNTRKIIWSKYYEEKPGGFGFRNYWVTIFSEALKDCSKDMKKMLR